MAKTAVVNGRRRKKRSGGRRRRRNYGAAAATANPRRRRRRSTRRRSYGAASHRRRRRRNPISPYASGGYRRTPNPLSVGSFGSALHQLMEVVPAGTAGILGVRFALKQSGAWSPDKAGVMQPGVWQALAMWLGATVTGAVVSTVFRSPSKGLYAKVAGLSFAGDLFLRQRFLRDTKFFQENFSLAGMGDDDEEEGYSDEGLIDGFQDQSALGEMWTDSDGNTWQNQGGQWALAGMGAGSGDIVQGPDGTLYQLSGGMGLDSRAGDGSVLAGFQSQSALGVARARHNPNSSFGYTP